MASRFRNEVTAVPAVTIRVGRQGLTTTIGWNPPGGGRPGHSIGGRPLGQLGDPSRSGPLPTDRFLIPGTRKDFGGGKVSDMTSPGLNGFKSLLLATQQREREIRADVGKAGRQLLLVRAIRALGWASLASVVAAPLRRRASSAVAVCRSELAALKDNLAATRISVDFNMETEVAEPHRRMQDALGNMAGSQRAWSVQTEQQIDRVKARSWAGTVVSRAAASLIRRADPLVGTKDAPFSIAVQGGRSTAYFYPGFVLVVDSARRDFALVDLADLDLSAGTNPFTETDAEPGDAARVGVTWAKANKNGSRDKRFAHNRQLPIMQYGGLRLSGPGGMNESLMFSRAEACSEFAAAAADLKRVLASGGAARRLADRPLLSGRG